MTLLTIELKTIMASFVSIFTAAIIFFSSFTWCNLSDGWKAEQGLNGGAEPSHERFARIRPFSLEKIFMNHTTLQQISPKGGLPF
jgi:hypothetical protein